MMNLPSSRVLLHQNGEEFPPPRHLLLRGSAQLLCLLKLRPKSKHKGRSAQQGIYMNLLTAGNETPTVTSFLTVRLFKVICIQTISPHPLVLDGESRSMAHTAHFQKHRPLVG